MNIYYCTRSIKYSYIKPLTLYFKLVTQDRRSKIDCFINRLEKIYLLELLLNNILVSLMKVYRAQNELKIWLKIKTIKIVDKFNKHIL